MVTTGACDSRPRETEPPVLQIEGPARGTITEAGRVIVEGTASDDGSGIDRVVVSGVDADRDGDRFSVELALDDGINVVQTIAIDRDGNETIDTRAVLSGQFADAQMLVPNAAALTITADSFSVLGDAASSALAAIDAAQLATDEKPIRLGDGKCLNAEIVIDDLELDDLDIDLAPIAGGVRAHITVQKLFAEGRAAYKLVCINGNAALSLAAESVDLVVSLDLSLGEDGALVAEIDEHSAEFVNLEFDVGIIPSEVVELITGELDVKVGELLSKKMGVALLPTLSNLIEKAKVEQTINLLGTELTLLVKPTKVEFNEDGGLIALDTRIASTSAEASSFLYTPMPQPSLSSGHGIQVMVADDALNQGLAALWSSGALSRSITLESETGAKLGGGILDIIRLDPLLPPVVGADGEAGTLTVTLGDLVVTLLKEGQTEPVSELAITARLGLNASVGDDGALHFGVIEPIIDFNRIGDQGFLTDGDLDILLAFASELIADDLDGIVGALPLPVVHGASFSNPSIGASGGYLQVGTSLSGGEGP